MLQTSEVCKFAGTWESDGDVMTSYIIRDELLMSWVASNGMEK